MSPATRPWQDWGHGNRERADHPVQPWTLGVEEEVMLVAPPGWNLAGAIDEVLPRLPPDVIAQYSPETHQAAVEIASGVHERVPDAIEEMRALRGTLRDTCEKLELACASAGTHPFTIWREVAVGRGERQAMVYGSMRELARREPTYALHVHVGVPDPEDAVRVLNRMRVHLPMLLALSANSPFWQGRDTGLASARTPLFQAFPRVGIPRRFEDFEDWCDTVGLLVDVEAFPEPTFLWWDVRLQPHHGTVETRIMDAQVTLDGTGSLVALVQSLARMECVDGVSDEAARAAPEVHDENRFLAARDGVNVTLIDPVAGARVPLRERLDELLPRLREHADDLGCRAELDAVDVLLAEPGAGHQLRLARRAQRLPGLVRALAAEF